MQKTAAEKPTKAFDLVKTFNSASLSISKLAVQPKRPPPPPILWQLLWPQFERYQRGGINLFLRESLKLDSLAGSAFASPTAEKEKMRKLIFGYKSQFWTISDGHEGIRNDWLWYFFNGDVFRLQSPSTCTFQAYFVTITVQLGFNWAPSDVNITLDGSTRMKNVMCCYINDFWMVKNAAGYHLGLIMPPSADGALFSSPSSFWMSGVTRNSVTKDNSRCSA